MERKRFRLPAFWPGKRRSEPWEARPGKARPWSGEKVYFHGAGFFRDFLSAVRKARKNIDIEAYIFEKGRLGDRLVAALVTAARRGVRVRLLVDGVGSPDFASHYGPRLAASGIAYRVYRPLAAFLAFVWDRFQWNHPSRSLRLIRPAWTRVKRRDHRKQYAVDGRSVWLGSFNVSDRQMGFVPGESAWRDTGVGLRGVKSPAFRTAFDLAWGDPWPRRWRSRRRRRRVRRLERDFGAGPLRITANRRLRRLFRRELLWRIRRARERIWITTPYFVPTGVLFRALADAARRGCDVRLLVPGESDVPAVRWASLAFYPGLLKAGCRIFEYQAGILHAKTVILDRWALVGSSNLDHRSLRQDLEINVALRPAPALGLLEGRFRSDLGRSREVGPADLGRHPFWVSLLTRLFFRFREWL